MSSSVIYADVTELVANPIRSGIQRVVREFLARWRGPRRLQPVIFDRGAIDLVELPAEAMELLTERDPAIKTLSVEEIAGRLRAIVEASPKTLVPHAHVDIVIPELFFDAMRAEHYWWRLSNPGTRLSLLVYDFIPWLRPEMIGVDRAGHLMYYLRLSALKTNAGFISEATYDDWRQRIVREPQRPGVVLPLGADGLPLERQTFDPSKKTIVCLGSIDGRKNQDMIAEAFERGWATGLDLDFVLVGYAFNKESGPARTISRIASTSPRMIHHERATDADLLGILRRARATIYMSTLEGYGLPPVESLHAGIPVIVSDRIPSIERLPSYGQIRISNPTPDEILGALFRVANNEEARHLWSGAASLKLPTWDDFADSVQKWLAPVAA